MLEIINKKKTFTQEEINRKQEYGREQYKNLSKTKKKWNAKNKKKVINKDWLMFSIIIKLAQIMQKVIKKYKNIVTLKELTD